MLAYTAKMKLERFQAVYDHVEANPGVSSAAICLHIGVNRQTARNWFRDLCNNGHLVATRGERSNKGGTPDTFVIGQAGRPVALKPRKKHSKRFDSAEDYEAPVRRRIIKAVQIGMWRDSLVEALFGPAQVSAWP